MTAKPWIYDLICCKPGPPMSKEGFVARYFPRYKEPYRLSYQLNMKPNGHPTRPTEATRKSQQTKRDNRVATAYAEYLELHKVAF